MPVTPPKVQTEPPAQPPDHYCDLVMKGGITSGIVYPAAIERLSRTYRFVHIGGASAGAIAAAGAAAAEFGRAQAASKGNPLPDDAGFLGLKKLSDLLSKDGRLLELFRPTSFVARMLFWVVQDVIDGVPFPVRMLYFLLLPFLLFTSAANVFIFLSFSQSIPVGWQWAIPSALAAVGSVAIMAWWNVYLRWSRLRKIDPDSTPTFGRAIYRWLLLPNGVRPGLAAGFAGFALGLFIVALIQRPWEFAFAWAAVSITIGLVLALLWAWFFTPWLLQSMVKNHLGLSTGHDSRYDTRYAKAKDWRVYDITDRATPPLTDFLFASLNKLANLGPEEVLTFGHLSQIEVGPPNSLGKREGITLRLMTSNLSLGRPFVFPLSQDTHFLFNEEELGQFFPRPVIEWMINHPPKNPPFPIKQGPLHYLPDADNLPVIVAVRISLSFPLIFCAVPLYGVTQDYTARYQTAKLDGTALPLLGERAEDLRLTYFSDGGIVSNFPIHMFDHWFPPYPTFGINLADLPEDSDRVKPSMLICPRGIADYKLSPDTDRVHLPNPGEAAPVGWQQISTPSDLAMSILYTAKNHRDNAQAELPGCSERIVTIRLKSNEGGLNLNMPQVVVEQIADLGRQAGDLLVERFGPNGDQLKKHQWLRLRSVLAHMERELRAILRAFPASDAQGESIANAIEQLLLVDSSADPRPGSKDEFPYPKDAAWRRRAYEVLVALRDLARDELQNGNVFDVDPPRPEAVKRVVPLEGDSPWSSH